MSAPYPWYDESARCAQGDPDRFIPKQGDNRYTVESAKAVCRGSNGDDPCPFLDPCLAYAVTHDVAGIWAATTEADRRRIRNRHGIKPVPLTVSDVFHGTAAASKAHTRRGEPVCERCRAGESERSARRRKAS